MARGGINKVHVMRARENLVAKGINPSIDAIRTELGNTGSKSTIHRYLREIEDEHGARLDDAALLSDTLQEMVGRLAARLREEANTLVEQATTQHQTLRQQWEAQSAAAQTALDSLRKMLQITETDLQRERTDREANQAALQQETIQSQRLAQQVADLNERLLENEKHRQSLEEKHQHARESLDHYRQSVKEQREQDQRRHEQQLQQFQAELRQLNQALIIKQNDITQLNKDNGRLVSELGEAKKQLSQQQSAQQKMERELVMTRDTVARTETQLANTERRLAEAVEEKTAADKRAQEYGERIRQQELEAARAETRQDAQRHQIEELTAELSVRQPLVEPGLLANNVVGRK